jgi:hypothetical protein
VLIAHRTLALIKHREINDHQQRLGFGACGRVIIQLLTEPGLDRVEEITIEDGRLRAGKDLTFIDERVSSGSFAEP